MNLLTSGVLEGPARQSTLKGGPPGEGAPGEHAPAPALPARPHCCRKLGMNQRPISL